MALTATTVLLALLTASTTRAQGQSAEGVVRISDRHVRQTSHCDVTGPACDTAMPPAAPGCDTVAPPAAPGPACDNRACAPAAPACPVQQPCCNQQCCDGPAWIHEGHECCMTGNPVIDWCICNKMKVTSAVMCHFYNCKARCAIKDGDCDECEGDCYDCNGNCNGKCKGKHKHKHKHKRGCGRNGCNNGCNNCNGNNCNGNGCNGNGCNGNGCNGNACNDPGSNPWGCGCCSRFPYPEGCGGQGCAWVDHYSVVYATLPEYADPRDGRVYSAEGYNVPVAVPLAPNVEYQYNYGWGIPSSRITPVSRFIPEYNYARPVAVTPATP